MKKVLIIDDDALVRMFLRQMIPWQEKGYRIVGDARDGEEGIQMLEDFKPDLVIVDISMPVMNGIDFLKAMKEQQFRGGIIMLSCHDDFEYVKTAMGLGADEYILKNHLNEKILYETLKAVEERMEKRSHEQDQQDELVAFAQKGIVEIRKEVLQKLLENDHISWKEQKKMFDTAHISGTFRQCAAVMALLPIEENDKKDTFLELCQQIAVSNHAEMIHLRKRACVFLVDLSEVKSSKKQYELLTALSNIIHNYAWEYLGTHFSIGVSEIICGAQTVARAVRQAERALSMSFYKWGKWTYKDAAKLCEGAPEKAEDLVAQLPYLIHLGDENKFVKEYAEALEGFADNWVMPQMVIDWVRRCDLAIGRRRDQITYIEMESIEHIRAYGETYIQDLRLLQSVIIPDHVSPGVKQAADYVKSNYHTGCSLSEAADHVGLTPTYLSARFKQEMGIGFVEYLTEVRINHVKWLMKREKHDTIKNISERAGFTDYQHFCKVFKKRVGCSPAVFRKDAQ